MKSSIKYFIIVLLHCSFLFLLGCANKINFIAISTSNNNLGGLYQVNGNEIKQIISLPYSNYIIKQQDKYFVTLGRSSSSKNSAIAVVKRQPNNSFVLEEINTYPIKVACHLTLSKDNQYLYTANYSSSSIAQIKLKNLTLTNDVKIIKHHGKSVTKRQKSSHPHQVLFNPKGDKLFVCDLGCDKVFIYDYDKNFGIDQNKVTTLLLAPGSGPRHLVFSLDSKAIFVNCELNSTVVSFALDEKSNTWKQGLTLSTLNKNAIEKGNYPGAIKISSCGKYFFVTNRGHDSIAIYKVLEQGNFALLDVVKTKSKYPSDILLLNNDTTLAVVGLKSNIISFFTFDKSKETLIPLEREIPIAKGISLGGY